MINRNQLELGLERPPGKRARFAAQNHRARARWWFSRMREVVDHARDWPTAPTAEGEFCPPGFLSRR
jgi:hypothetical protein